MGEDRDERSVLEELKLIYRAAPIGLCFLDTELRYVRINEHLAAINGKPAADHVGRTIREVIPEIADIVEPVYRNVFETGEPTLDLEMRGVTEAVPRMERPYLVNFFPVTCDGRVIGVNTMVLDISEQEVVRRRLRRGDQILGQVHDAVITTDMKGIVRTWNAAAERIYGYTANEAAGRNIEFLHCPADLPTRLERVMRPLLERGSNEVVVRNRTKCGREIYVAVRLSLLENESGVPLGVISCSNDVTEKRRLQDELLRVSTSEQRRIGQELHDMTGQELAGMRYLARTLVRSLEKSGADTELALTIEEGLSRSLAHVREMARGLVPVEVDAEGLMEALTTLARSVSERDGIGCAFDYDEPTPIRDNAVATHLYRIAKEGVTNALKHSRATRIDIELLRQGEVFELRIVDDGVGLNASEPPTGLGMQIMAYRAEMIGAAIKFDSGDEGGTRITLTLPDPG